MTGRTIAIGDVHGCLAALVAILDAVQPTSKDTLVTLGDYIDRGPDSRGVIATLIDQGSRCRRIPLMGDHEDMLLNGLCDNASLRKWLTCGGIDTLRSYGWVAGGARRALDEWIRESHLAFLRTCRLHYETETHLFVHAGFVPEMPIDQQPRLALLWRATNAMTSRPHVSGKRVVVGHTAQTSGEILDLGFLTCIDTNCVRGGWLTALDTTTGRIWQADRFGHLRP